MDNSRLGREAMAEGRPPKVIQVYSDKHRRKPHGEYGALGDRVLCAVKGEKIQVRKDRGFFLAHYVTVTREPFPRSRCRGVSAVGTPQNNIKSL